MCVQSQIKNDWQIAIKGSLKPRFPQTEGKIKIAVDSSGIEFFIKSETETTYFVTRPDGVSCNVYKKGFRARLVNKDYILKPLKLS